MRLTGRPDVTAERMRIILAGRLPGMRSSRTVLYVEDGSTTKTVALALALASKRSGLGLGLDVLASTPVSRL